MFNWIRRQGNAPAAPRPAADKAVAPTAARPALPAAIPPATPLPEVIGEGNTQADWSAWEDSVATLDSQLQDLGPSRGVYVRDTSPSQLDELDPFTSVRNKRA